MSLHHVGPAGYVAACCLLHVTAAQIFTDYLMVKGTVYECEPGGTITALQAYYDPNVRLLPFFAQVFMSSQTMLRWFAWTYSILCTPSLLLLCPLCVFTCWLQPEEEFFVCKWSTNTTTGAPLLLLAGATGAIRVVDCHLREVVWVSPFPLPASPTLFSPATPPLPLPPQHAHAPPPPTHPNHPFLDCVM